MPLRHGTLSGSVLDSSMRTIGTITRLVLVGDPRHSGRPLRGLGEMTPPLRKCPDCYWLRIRQVGLLRIRVTSLDPSAPGVSLMHFTVLSARQSRPGTPGRCIPPRVRR